MSEQETALAGHYGVVLISALVTAVSPSGKAAGFEPAIPRFES